MALGSDARFTTAAGRRESAPALVAELDARLVRRDAGQWLAAWRERGIACSEVRNLAQLAEDPQAWDNDYFLRTHCDEVNREVTIRGMPVTFEKTPGEVRSLGPELGQDTEIILTETLGYTWDDVGRLKDAGVIL